jgi:hypothetical protein
LMAISFHLPSLLQAEMVEIVDLLNCSLLVGKENKRHGRPGGNHSV